LFSAFAAAERTTLATTLAHGDWRRFRVSMALLTGMPLTKSMMGFSLLGDAPTPLAVALASGTGPSLPLYRRLAWLLLVRSDLATWPLKVLVGANSPSLCPTVFSVMYTGTWRRPSWTPMVKPTMSGRIVDALDHVLITVLSPAP
jgi:hypothetical protein